MTPCLFLWFRLGWLSVVISLGYLSLFHGFLLAISETIVGVAAVSRLWPLLADFSTGHHFSVVKGISHLPLPEELKHADGAPASPQR